MAKSNYSVLSSPLRDPNAESAPIGGSHPDGLDSPESERLLFVLALSKNVVIASEIAGEAVMWSVVIAGNVVVAAAVYTPTKVQQ